MNECAVIEHNQVYAVLVIWSVQKISEIFDIILQRASNHEGKNIERKMDEKVQKQKGTELDSSRTMTKEKTWGKCVSTSFHNALG